MQYPRVQYRGRYLSYLCLITIIFFAACKKTEQPAPPANPGSGRFLQIDPGSPVAIQRIVSDLSMHENAYPFLDKMIETDGMPFWKDAEIYYPSQQQPDTMVLLPLVRKDSGYVNSILVCKLHADKVVFILVRGQDYQYYGYDKTLRKFSADLTATMLMRFDYKIFGDSLFIVHDPELFKSDTPTRKPRIFSVPKNKINANARTYVYGSYECTGYMHNGDEGQLVGVEPGGSNDYYYGEENCQWVITVYDIPDGPSGGGSTGGGITPPPGTGGGGIGGGGGGGTTPIGGGVAPSPRPGVILLPPAPRPPLTPAFPGLPTSPPVIPAPPQTDANGFYYDRISELGAALGGNLNLMLPCPEIELLKSFGNFYNDLNNFIPPPVAWNRINDLKNVYGGNEYWLQTVDKAEAATVNADFFPLQINDFPAVNGSKLDQKTLVEYFRTHINDFVPNGMASFVPYTYDAIDGQQPDVDDTQRWNSPYNDALGSMVHIDLVNDGTVMLTEYVQRTGSIPGVDFTFTTMHSPKDDAHPVSGNRRFGVYEANGKNIFYIGGMDRITTNTLSFGNEVGSLVRNSGFIDADILWTGVRDNMMNFITSHGGSAERSNMPDLKIRVDYALLSSYLKKEIDLATLKQKLECD